jgi:hypothetical protein
MAMPTNERKRGIRRDLGVAAALIAAGLIMSGLSAADLLARHPQRFAQGTPPLQGTPSPESTDKPAEPKPGGTRPTTPAPEPARPDPQAQKEGVKPALPPAPAEKMAPPINQPEKTK